MLKKKAKKTFDIASIDNYTQRSYLMQGQSIAPNTKLSFNNHTLFATYLANKDMIVAPIEIGAGITEEDLTGVLENRAYEELGLDPTIEYLINHLEIPYEGDGKMYQLFIIDKMSYHDAFEDLQQKVQYIDYIAPAPLLFKTLYDLELVESKGVHCYLYFTKYDTFITFYKDGKYLYSKSIQYSFEQIYNRYCEMVGEAVDEENFFKILQKEGMRATEIEYQQNIMKLFGEIFISINDIVIYTKRAYDLDIIDQIFIGSSSGPIVGLDDYAQNYLGLYSSALDFDFNFKTDEWYIDQLQYMTIVGALQWSKHLDYTLNMTLYPRPPAFFKRPSGQAFISAVVAIGIGLAYPTYHYVLATANETRNSILAEKEVELNKQVLKYKAILGKKRKIVNTLQKQIKQSQNLFLSKEKTLSSVYNKKVFYRLKSDQFKAFADDLISHNVKTYDIETMGDIYRISLVAQDDKDITKLIADISEKYKDEISSIDIKMISKEDNSTFYQGVLKVVLQ